MKVSISFDTNTRHLLLTPEDELERVVLDELAMRSDKGTTCKISKIETDFRIVMDISGKGPRQNDCGFHQRVDDLSIPRE